MAYVKCIRAALRGVICEPAFWESGRIVFQLLQGICIIFLGMLGENFGTSATKRGVLTMRGTARMQNGWHWWYHGLLWFCSAFQLYREPSCFTPLVPTMAKGDMFYCQIENGNADGKKRRCKIATCNMCAISLWCSPITNKQKYIITRILICIQFWCAHWNCLRC